MSSIHVIHVQVIHIFLILDVIRLCDIIKEARFDVILTASTFLNKSHLFLLTPAPKKKKKVQHTSHHHTTRI